MTIDVGGSTNTGIASTDIISHINAIEQKQYELIKLFLIC